MKTKIYFRSLALMMVGAMATTGCTYDDLNLYDGPDAAIYIQQINTTDIYGNPLSYKEGDAVSFAGASAETVKGTRYIYVKMMGNLANYDRPYTFTVDEENTTAEPSDYSLEDNDFVIKASQSADTVRVTIFRTQKLRKQTMRLGLKIEPNEHFSIAMEEFKNSANWQTDGVMYDATKYYIDFNENYTCPFYWRMFGNSYFGDFTPSRFVELNNLMGYTMTDWNNAGMSSSKVQYGRMAYAARAFQKYLQEMADAGTPVLDDDGSYMQLPADYAVDYSAYE